MVSMKSAVRAALPVILVLGLVSAVIAQQVRSFHGRVNWIQGTTMAFTPDTGGAFEVDLSKLDQTAYQFLKSGAAVTVVGLVSAEGNRVVATSITPDR
jgi:hypothetical protein